MTRHRDPETGIVLLGFLIVLFLILGLLAADWLVAHLVQVLQAVGL